MSEGMTCDVFVRRLSITMEDFYEMNPSVRFSMLMVKYWHMLIIVPGQKRLFWLDSGYKLLRLFAGT
jgi:hypothetical protein